MKNGMYRGKRTDNGEWVYGYYTQWKDGARLSHVILEVGEGLGKDDMIKWYVDPETVGQRTGLKDWYSGDRGRLAIEGTAIVIEGIIQQTESGEWELYEDDKNHVGLHHNINRITKTGNMHDKGGNQ